MKDVLSYLAWWPKRHPGGWHTIAFLLAHLHTFILLLGVVPYIFLDMFYNGYGKYVYWSNQIYLLFTEHTALMLLLLVGGVAILVFLYIVVWRLFFNDYYRIIHVAEGKPGIRLRDSRVYYIRGYGFSDWARKRRNKTINDTQKHEPAPSSYVIYYNDRWIFNIFLPLHSLKTMNDVKNGNIKNDGIYKKLVTEHGRTVRLDDSGRMYGIDPHPLVMYPSDLKSSERQLQLSINQLLRDAVKVSKADSQEIKEKYRYTSSMIPENVHKELREKTLEILNKGEVVEDE